MAEGFGERNQFEKPEAGQTAEGGTLEGGGMLTLSWQVWLIIRKGPSPPRNRKNKKGRSRFSPPFSGSWRFTGLFQHHHLPRLHKIPCLKPVEVDPTGERACIPPGCFVCGFLLFMNEGCYLLNFTTV